MQFFGLHNMICQWKRLHFVNIEKMRHLLLQLWQCGSRCVITRFHGLLRHFRRRKMMILKNIFFCSEKSLFSQSVCATAAIKNAAWNFQFSKLLHIVQNRKITTSSPLVWSVSLKISWMTHQGVKLLNSMKLLHAKLLTVLKISFHNCKAKLSTSDFIQLLNTQFYSHMIQI